MRGYFFGLAVVFCFLTNAQVAVEKNFYTSPLKKNTIAEFSFKSAFAQINLQSTTNENPYTIKGFVDDQKFETVFKQSEIEFKKKHELQLKEKNSSGLNSSPFKFLSGSENNFASDWLIFVGNRYNHDLEFNIGNGSLDMNLSNIPSKVIKINSIKASNSLYYQLGQPNKTILDTLQIKNELGNVQVKNFSLANCAFLSCELGFGKMNFHMGGISNLPAKYKFKIGTGELMFKVPYKEMPVKLVIIGSSLSKVEIPKEFVKMDKRTYLSPTYADDSKNKLIVEIDVSLGKVIIQ
ncbi:MAG: hypothetical protein SNJ77_10850 [Cytophagales bacterium]